LVAPPQPIVGDAQRPRLAKARAIEETGDGPDACWIVHRRWSGAVVAVRTVTIVLHVIFSVVLAQPPAPLPPGTPGPADTLARTGLSQNEIRQVVAAVEANAFDTPASWTDELRATRVDLGSSAGLVVRGSKLLCGATGNCQLFVLRRVNDRWVSLFGDRQAPIADTISFGPGATNEIKDVTLTANVSASNSSRITYSFDGNVYSARN
jgi:hypothetical protein